MGKGRRPKKNASQANNSSSASRKNQEVHGKGKKKSGGKQEEAPILQKEFDGFLKSVAAQLDPVSFLKFRLSCKKFNKLCNDVTIQLHAHVDIGKGFRDETIVPLFKPVHWLKDKKRHADVLVLDRLRKAVQQRRVEIIVEHVAYSFDISDHEEKWEESDRRLVDFLTYLGVKTVKFLDPDLFSDGSNCMTFLEKFKVRMIYGYWQFHPSYVKRREFYRTDIFDVIVSPELLKESPTFGDILTHSRFKKIVLKVENSPEEEEKSEGEETTGEAEEEMAEEEDEDEMVTADEFEVDEDEEEEVCDGCEEDDELEGEDEKEEPHGICIEAFRMFLKIWSVTLERQVVSLRFSCSFSEEEFVDAFSVFPSIKELGEESLQRPIYYADKTFDSHWLQRIDGHALCCWYEENWVEVMLAERAFLPWFFYPQFTPFFTPWIHKMILPDVSMHKGPQDIEDEEKPATFHDLTKREQLSINAASQFNEKSALVQALKKEKKAIQKIIRMLDRKSYGALLASCHAVRDFCTGDASHVEVAFIGVNKTTRDVPFTTFSFMNVDRPLSVPALHGFVEALKNQRVALVMTGLTHENEEDLDDPDSDDDELDIEDMEDVVIKNDIILDDKRDFHHVTGLLKFLDVAEWSLVVPTLTCLEMFRNVDPEKVSKLLVDYGCRIVIGGWFFSAKALTLPGFKKLTTLCLTVPKEFWTRPKFIRENGAKVKDMANGDFILRANPHIFAVDCEGSGGFELNVFESVVKECLRLNSVVKQRVFVVRFGCQAFKHVFREFHESHEDIERPLSGKRPLAARIEFDGYEPSIYLLRGDGVVVQFEYFKNDNGNFQVRILRPYRVPLRLERRDRIPAVFYEAQEDSS